MRYNKIINSIVWWIPFKNIRNFFRDILTSLLKYDELNNNLVSLERKIENIHSLINLELKNIYYDNLKDVYEYNSIISIGMKCFTTEILRINNKKKYSYVFDNLGIPSDLAKVSLFNNLEIIINRFNNFFNINDLEFICIDESNDLYYNKFTKLYHRHDFKNGNEFKQEYDIALDKYNRRINRFIRELESGNRILLFHIESYGYDNNYLDLQEMDKLLNKIRDVYNNNNIDLLFIRNNPSYPNDKIDFTIVNNKIHLYVINNYFSVPNHINAVEKGYREGWIGNIENVSKILSMYKVKF